MSHLSIANRSRLSHTQSSLSESADTGRLGNRLLRWIREGHALLSRFIRHLYNYYVSPQREAAPEHRRAACELREKGATFQRSVQNVISEPEYSAFNTLWSSDYYPDPGYVMRPGKALKPKRVKHTRPDNLQPSTGRGAGASSKINTVSQVKETQKPTEARNTIKWTFDDSGVKPDGSVTPAAMKTYDDWKALVCNGTHPAKAARSLQKDVHFETLSPPSAKGQLCSIRLSQKHRVVFNIVDTEHRVEVLRTGGHP
ncbi:hypothetical protein AH775_18715 [Salmonella enterica subsp. enterica serovar Give]|nr:hypothetical protein [Salmonella enterica subsp. enterica serovar Give]ECO0044636.1 hypothetical protein [Salmonella enterica subsp. enterica serovar Infantis]EDG5395603.1 hypothetical protein [Salmonella enterica subsp. enterica serovar Bovismorbificans]EEA7773791.1 hypothetical protein [Salmonella enterica subsp. enterica serovar Manchester]EGZ3890938.1 hypothetical protein [Salmonella enterica subsp. enterica serovar Bonn]